MAKPHLTLEQHRHLGLRLKAMRDGLVRLRLPYPKSYPSQKALTRAIRAIDSLRCRLDGQLAKETWDHFDPRVYYPGHTAPDTPSILDEVEA